LNRQAVTFIERCERKPTSESLLRLALAVGLRPSDVWDRAEAKFSARWWKKAEAKGSSRA
jgi:hypothetical protein